MRGVVLAFENIHANTEFALPKLRKLHGNAEKTSAERIRQIINHVEKTAEVYPK